MILNLILIRSNEKFQLRLTRKRNLNIGSDDTADIIVNHPQLYGKTQTIGPVLSSVKTRLENRVHPHFFRSYSWHTDGTWIRMIELKRFLAAILIPCFFLTLIILLLLGGITPFEPQDWTPINLPTKGIYGFCRQDQKHREGVRLSFEARKAQAYRLFFTAGGKGDGTVITFSINGVPVSDSLPLPNGWGKETTILLPSDRIVNGTNIVEIRPAKSSTEGVSWGISEIRATSLLTPNTDYPNSGQYTPESILNALRKSDVKGRELARFYEAARSWQSLNSAETSHHDNKSTMEIIEIKMRERLYQIAFEVRSHRIQGDDRKVDQLLDETRGWIPEGWSEGWEIYNGLCR